MPRLGQALVVPRLSAVEVKIIGFCAVPLAKILPPRVTKSAPNWVVSLVPLMMVPASMFSTELFSTYTLPTRW